jgi:hypothetical protein
MTPVEFLLENRRINLKTNCWEWSGLIGTNGYGKARYKGRNISPHRFSYESFVGTIPNGMHVCHQCDNRPCFNPEHLFLGTAKDNAQDMVRKGRSLTGSRHSMHKLTDCDVRTVLDLLACGWPKARIASLFGVSSYTIYSISTGKTWKHITD